MWEYPQLRSETGQKKKCSIYPIKWIVKILNLTLIPSTSPTVNRSCRGNKSEELPPNFKSVSRTYYPQKSPINHSRDNLAIDITFVDM